jgi:sugar phosphate isomerase/epimerase
MLKVVENVQIHIPFTMLCESYLEHFIEKKFNPEIYFNSDALDKYLVDDFKGVADKLHQYGLKITLHAPFWDLSPGSPDPAVRDLTRRRFEQTIQLVSIFKPKTVVCHTGYDQKRYGFIKDLWVKNSVEIWTWLSEEIAAEGGYLMLENVYEHYPDDILILLEHLKNTRIGFCLDVGHQAVFSRSPLTQWIDVLGEHLKQLHLHDNFGESDNHLALGDGNINFSEIFMFVKHLKQKPMAVTIEPHREQDLLPSLKYLEKVRPRIKW